MGAAKEETLIRVFSENCAHIRHMEYYRMWCVNIYGVVVAGLGYALATEKLDQYFNYVAAFLVLFTVFNLLLAIKIEAIINNFVDKTEKIVAKLKIDDYISIRTREGVWNLIRFQWIFPAFYCLALAGIAVLIALH